MSPASTMPRDDFIPDLRSLEAYLGCGATTRVAVGGGDIGDLVALGTRLSDATNLARQHAKAALVRHLERFPQSPLATQISLFEVLGFHREEVAHTRTLAWLLDRGQGHGFGIALFEALLKAAAGKSTGDSVSGLSRIDAGNLLSVEAEYVISPRRRVDLYIEGESTGGAPWCVLVEAKVDANEGASQLSDYAAATTSRTATHLYLTRDGKLPREKCNTDLWIPIGFRDLAREFLQAAPRLTHAPGYPLLQMYLVGILQEFCDITLPIISGPEAIIRQPYALIQILDEIQ